MLFREGSQACIEITQHTPIFTQYAKRHVQTYLSIIVSLYKCTSLNKDDTICLNEDKGEPNRLLIWVTAAHPVQTAVSRTYNRGGV